MERRLPSAVRELSSAAGLHARKRLHLVLGVALAVVGGSVALGMLLRPPDQGTPAGVGVRLVSACDGVIGEWLLATPVNERSFFLATQADLIAKSDPAIRFRVVSAHPESRSALERAVRTRNAAALKRVDWFEHDQAVAPWTCDYFLMAAAPDGGALALLHHPEHYALAWGTWTLRDPLVYARCLTDTATRATQNRLEGGQVVANAERAFVSRAVLERSLRAGDAREERGARLALEATLGLPVTWVPYADMGPSDHCDLYLMVVGERRVVLSSPALGARLAGRLSTQARAALGEALRRRAAAEGVEPAVLASGGKDLVDTLIERSRAPRCLAAFKRLRSQLLALGYTVVEAPFLFLDEARDGLQLCLSYTNVVQDVRAGVRTVYAPSYGFEELDIEAHATWRKLGYRVVPIDALGPAMVCGSIRCLSQVRKPPAAQRVP